MPTIYVPRGAEYSGVEITRTPTNSRLHISGWHDSIVGIEGESMSLREFFDRLGITEKACQKAWRAKDKEAA